MFVALHEDGRFAYASEVKIHSEQSRDFYCPNCYERVFFKVSKKDKAFFSHLTECRQNKQRAKPIESKEHLLGKEILHIELAKNKKIDIQTELYFPEINQYADICFKTAEPTAKKIIYEFQRSVIPAHDLYLRQINYERHVDEVHWLMDYQTTKSLDIHQSWSQTMLNYNQQLGFHLKRLNLKAKEIVVDYNLPILYRKGAYQYKRVRIPCQKFIEWDWPIKETNELIQKSAESNKETHYHKQLNRIMNNVTYRDDVFELYQEGTLLSELPEWVFTQDWECLLTTKPTWNMFAWVLTILRQLPNTFSTDDFVQAIRASQRLALANFPLIKWGLLPILCQAIIVLLMRQKIIKPVSENSWQKIN